MMAAATTEKVEPWRRRLYLPNYNVGEAARYARISPRTVAEWQKAGARQALSAREQRESLSYMQLIEVAVVAAFREAGVSLARVRAAREYVRNELKSEFPFAEYRFKTDGKRLLMDYQQVAGAKGKGKLLRPDQGGQLAWEEMFQHRLKEFEYERKGIVLRWHVAGEGSPIIIDPRIAFGAPAISGTPTWILKGRWAAGESVSDIADDFEISERAVQEALKFEGVDPDAKQWKH